MVIVFALCSSSDRHTELSEEAEPSEDELTEQSDGETDLKWMQL